MHSPYILVGTERSKFVFLFSEAELNSARILIRRVDNRTAALCGIAELFRAYGCADIYIVRRCKKISKRVADVPPDDIQRE